MKNIKNTALIFTLRTNPKSYLGVLMKINTPKQFRKLRCILKKKRTF